MNNAIVRFALGGTCYNRVIGASIYYTFERGYRLEKDRSDGQADVASRYLCTTSL